MLGRAAKVVITKDDTIVLGGTGEKKAIEERIALIKETIKNSQSDYEKEKLHERLAKLSGGVAVIKVMNECHRQRGKRGKEFSPCLCFCFRSLSSPLGWWCFRGRSQ